MNTSDTLKGLLALGLPTDSDEFETKTKESAGSIVDDSAVSNQKVYSSSKIEARLAEITALADEIEGDANTFADLPSASSKSGKIYSVLNSTGTLGTNRKSAGLYRSNGTDWFPLSDFDAIAAQLHANTLAIDGKESLIAPGTQAQFFRGDKTWQTLTKNIVGLGNVDNTADIDKPISVATQDALDEKEPLITTGTNTQYIRGDKTLSDFASDVAQAQASAMALKANLSDIPSVAFDQSLLSQVAFTGSYNDLSDRPIIPGIYQVGGTDRYDATSLGPVTSDNYIRNYYMAGALPSSGELTYILIKNGANQEMTVPFIKDANGNLLFPGIYQVGGTDRYDATSLGPVLSVDVIGNHLSAGALPSSGRLTYILAKGGGNQEVTVSYRKTGSTISQSAFTLSGNTLAYTGNAQSMLFYSNDDHDSLFVDASGAGILARTNTDILNSGTWDKFRGSMELVVNGPLNSVLMYPFGDVAEGNATIVSFPGTESAVLLNLTSGTYKVNNSSVRSMPAPLNAIASQSTWSRVANTLWTISDGINQFMIGRYGSQTAYLVTVDLTSFVITASSITLEVAPARSELNGTEEEAIGTQLFTVDGTNNWLSNTVYYYGGTKDWKTNTNVFDTAGKSGFVAGPTSTATDMDIWGSIDSSGYVWFADWGHDNGGLFEIGNDDRLNTRRTNIQYVAK